VRNIASRLSWRPVAEHLCSQCAAAAAAALSTNDVDATVPSVKKLWRQEVAIFPTKEIMGAQNFNFVPKFSTNKDLQAQILYVGRTFS